MTDPKPLHDYIAEVNLAPGALAGGLFEALNEADYSISPFEKDGQCHFIADRHPHFFFMDFLRAYPHHVKGVLTATSNGRCRLSMNYDPSRNTVRWFFVLVTLFGALHGVVAVLLLRDISSPTAHMMVARLGGINRLAMAYAATAAAIVGFGIMYIALSGRYQLWGRMLLRSAVRRIEGRNPAIKYESPLATFTKKPGLWIYAGTFLVLPAVLSRPGILGQILRAPEILGLVFVVLALLVLFRINRNRRYLRGKLSPTHASSLLALGVLLALLMPPLLMYRFSQPLASLTKGYSSKTIRGDESRVAMTLQRMPQVQIPAFMSTVRFGGLLFVLALAIVGMIILVILIFVGRLFEYYHGDNNPDQHQRSRAEPEQIAYSHDGNNSSQHQQSMRFLYDSLPIARPASPSQDVRLSWVSQGAVWCIFVMFSGLCWAGLFLNLSVFGALFLPPAWFSPFPFNATILAGTDFYARAFLGVGASQEKVQVFRFGVVLLSLASFVGFIVLHLVFVVRRQRSHGRLTSVPKPVADLVACACREVGVTDVQVVLNPDWAKSSPYAEFHGLVPRKRIVIGPAFVAFARKYPDHARAAIAHEAAHLKNDLIPLWLNPFLSRLGLMGAGFLSILENSFAMEDRVDETTRLYLTTMTLKHELIGETAILMLLEDSSNTDNSIPNESAYIGSGLPQKISAQPPPSRWKALFHPLRLAYYLYFEDTRYDYLHRSPRHRAKDANPRKTE